MTYLNNYIPRNQSREKEIKKFSIYNPQVYLGNNNTTIT